jgi:tetratricopeptide (TPR) repeat protein
LKKPFLILAAAVAGICQGVPEAFNLAGAIASAGRGALGGSWTDRLVAAASHAGGWVLAEFVRFALSAAPWFLGFLVLFFVAANFPVRWRRAARALVWLGWWATIVIGVWNGWDAWRDRIDDPRLLAPLALIKAAQAHSQRVFINPSALPAVAAWAPELVDRELAPKMRSRLVQAPVQWREEDHTRPFSAVLLSGRLPEAKPLIQHLLDSPDWHLAAVDNQGMLFFRGNEPDRSEAEVPAFASPKDRALYLAQYALCLDAAGLKTRATQSIDQAMDLAGNDFEILIRAASLAASRSRWEQSRKLATKAREKRPGNFEADYLLAWSFLETRAFDKAFEMTSRLAGSYPNDFSVLLLHARACHASKNFSAETAVLEQLLQLAGDDKIASTRIHIYLGQSWTQRGFPDQALTHYKLALEGNPAPAESRDIREAIQTIEASRLPTAP